MANNKAAPGPAPEPKQTDKAPEFFDIGELRSKHKIGWAVFAGVCAAKEWKPARPSPRRSSSRQFVSSTRPP